MADFGMVKNEAERERRGEADSNAKFGCGVRNAERMEVGKVRG